MKTSNFSQTLKGLGLDKLNSLRATHLDIMLKLMSVEHKDWEKHSKYISDIDQAIKKFN